MADLYNQELIEFYKKSFENLINQSQEQITNEYLSEFHS